MKKLLITAICSFVAIVSASAQTATTVVDTTVNTQSIIVDSVTTELTNKEKKESLIEYRRSSLYSVLIKQPTLKYGETIDSVFMSMPIPDKFNNHDLEHKSFSSTSKKAKRKGKKKEKENMIDIANFVETKAIPKELVAKWFCRDEKTGAFSLDCVMERGFYDASQDDINQADNNMYGRNMLADAGTDLIGKTFVMINDITFIDHAENAKLAGGIMKGLGSLAGALLDSPEITSLSNTAGELVEEIEGFAVNITTYLYRLHWDDEVLASFYDGMWIDSMGMDQSKKMVFDTTKMFKLKYVGVTTTTAQNVAIGAFAKKTHAEQLTKVCTRAIDKSIVELQREYDEFKVNVPISKVCTETGTVEVPIGLKEGLNPKSKYEVLVEEEDENGKLIYAKVGTIVPVKGKIWDNRFGALEEQVAIENMTDEEKKAAKQDKGAGEEAVESNAKLTASTFKIVTGAKKIFSGCLVREVTIKRN